MSELKPREIAAKVLTDRLDPQDFLETSLDKAFLEHPVAPVDRRFIQELVYGVVRWQLALDHLISLKANQAEVSAPAKVLLQMALYQLFWLDRVPDYAAVNETVEAAKNLGLTSQTGFLNAVLRNYCREEAETQKLLEDLKKSQPALGHAHPHWLWKRWHNRWDAEKTVALMRWNNTPPPTFARINSLKIDPVTLTARWRREGVEFQEREWDWTGDKLVYELLKHPPLAELASHQDGFFYIQDPSTLLAVQALGLKLGESVLDACAAPGGKTTFIAQRLQNQGRVVAHDIQRERLQLVRDNCERLDAHCVTISKGDSLPAITTRPIYDKILADTPCSNTGVMRRRIELRHRLREEDFTRLQATQLGLLNRLASLVKPGGAMVYSTCSLEPEENQVVVTQFLTSRKDFVREFERQLLPFNDGVDGAYVARLRKKDRP